MKQILKYIYSVLTENLKQAEGKHSVLIALNSAIAVFISGYLKNTSLVIKFISCIIIIFSVFSLFFSFVALLSRKIKYYKNIKEISQDLNLIYYKHIIKFSYEKYLREIKKRYDFPSDYEFDGLDEDIAKQIIATANVTNLKFTYFNYSIFCLLFELLLTILNVSLVGLGI